MSQFDANKDYYGVLGVEKNASPREIYRQYKRQASKHHPDRGGSEEQMKSLNEAYGVLRDATSRSAYDDVRENGARGGATHASNRASDLAPASTPAAREVGVWGQGLSALLCLIAGLFLLLLVRMQWMWFLWPLAILAVFVTGFGVLLARSVMVAANDLLPVTNRFKRHTKLQELAFWTVIVTTGYGLYWLLSY
jgi:curved DNA-binding protein CbpA